MGLWFRTRHTAFLPQVFSVQGSTHFWFTQALSAEHSEEMVHSGRQTGGAPTNWGRQEHTACSFETRH